jgi:uncharacterized membrane protein YeaQ/YmgE (transglycosylase-associated protein family)
MHIIWTIIIGFIAGVIAKFVTPGKNEPSGFILTTILGIVGAFVATYLGQAIGWYRADEGAGLMGSVVGAVIILLILGIHCWPPQLVALAKPHFRGWRFCLDLRGQGSIVAALGTRSVCFRREPALRCVFIDGVGEFAGQPREQLFPG